MTYKDLLLENDWRLKCNEILNRDHYICQDCGSLGFHIGGNFISLSSVSEIDSLLKDWRFNSFSFSEFIGKSPMSKIRKIIINNSEEINIHNDVHIYSIWLKSKASFSEKVGLFGIKAICDYPLTTIVEAGLCIGNNVSNIKRSDEGGRVVYIEFNQQLSSTTYVNIEHLHNVSIDTTLINVTSENKVISIRLSSDCGIKGLNVHHRYYTKGSKPWEYSNDALLTLCQDCHCKRHKDAKVPLYTPDHQLIKHLIPCSRCGGSGYLPQYNHVENGICFKCGGEGVILDD